MRAAQEDGKIRKNTLSIIETETDKILTITDIFLNERVKTKPIV